MVHLRQTREILLTAITILGVLSLLMTSPVGSGRASAQDQAAADLLAGAAAAMAEVQSFHFEVTTPRGETRFAEGFALLGLSGDVQRPDRFRATARVDATLAQLELHVIGVGTTIWVSDPLSAAGGYIELSLGDGGMGEGATFADLVNPDRLLLTAVNAVEDPVIAGQDEIDGVTTTRINGVARLDPLSDAGLTGTAIAGSATLIGDPVQVAIWIDKQHLVRQLDVYGPLLASEAPNTVRRLKLTAIDEPVDIQAPPPSTPTAP